MEMPPAPLPAPPIAAEPPATAQPLATITPDPVQNWMAPEGTFFVSRQTSIETPEGLVGLRPGTKVQKQPDGRFLTDDQRIVTLQPDSVTNDLRVAQRVAAQDQQAQAAIRQAAAAASRARPEAVPSPPSRTSFRTTPVQPAAPPRAPFTSQGSSLDRKTFNDTDIRRRP